MIPHEPPRQPYMGFLFFPPYRVQGYSIAGEETVIQVPELDVCFDLGRCPRMALTSNYVALSHGHMDHSAGLAYYFSQRHFQGMGVGTVLCHEKLADPIHRLMRAWVDIEKQRSPYNVHPMTHNSEFEIKNTIYLRAFDTNHTSSSLGYSVVEKRSKLRPDLVGFPQEKLVQLKEQGEEITYIKEVPLVAFTGDTTPGDHFDRDDVKNAQVLICECTFLEEDHKERARIGRHLHIDHIVELLPSLKNQTIVLTHMSRRTHMAYARQRLAEVIPKSEQDRIFLLMDGRANRARFQHQLEEDQVGD